ncbi:hypothetical protein FOMA001_g13412 [Fusarium oxysporum f. sp. matthiolae]|nr:hypothetical protein FOMA001_g13412 [Fusarium oxysporum f. sp. matthiolae]
MSDCLTFHNTEVAVRNQADGFSIRWLDQAVSQGVRQGRRKWCGDAANVAQ